MSSTNIYSLSDVLVSKLRQPFDSNYKRTSSFVIRLEQRASQNLKAVQPTSVASFSICGESITKAPQKATPRSGSPFRASVTSPRAVPASADWRSWGHREAARHRWCIDRGPAGPDQTGTGQRRPTVAIRTPRRRPGAQSGVIVRRPATGI